MGSQETVIRNIKILMAEKGLSSNRFADFSGLSRGYVADLLANRKLRNSKEPPSMSLRTLDKLAHALEVKTIDLLSEE